MPTSRIQEPIKNNMNNKLVFISNIQNSFTENVKQEAEPKHLSLIQFNDLEQPYISKKFHKNISIPDFKIIDDIGIPSEYRFIDRICTTNDLTFDLCKNAGFEASRLNYKWDPVDNQLQINSLYRDSFKYGAVFNYRDDQVILQDLLYVYYEATKNIDNIILILYVANENQNETIEDIQKLHNRIGIKPQQSKILLYTQTSFDDVSKMALINICDSMLILNAISIDEIIYNHTIFRNKSLVSKYRLSDKDNVTMIATTKKMIKYKGKRRFYQHIDTHSLYQSFSNQNRHMQIINNHQPPLSTNIAFLL